jgi:hypothetical protein
MRTILILASAALATAAALVGPAAADDRLHLTPPLYREQARNTREVHPAGDLTTTPQPVVAPSAQVRSTSALVRPLIQASAEVSR